MLRINLPKKEINTFYAFSEEVPSEEYCRGLACYVARNLKPEIWKKAVSQNTRTYCLGKCYSSPSSSSYDEKPIIQNKSRESILLKYMIKENSNIKDYLALGGFKS
ncbi:MAG: NADH-quinone oxidoreductase subunit D, partial [Caldisphaera sp.]|nr:NADH-quinone oxidoreductase subunit D [Caldisphaera sp.]